MSEPIIYLESPHDRRKGARMVTLDEKAIDMLAHKMGRAFVHQYSQSADVPALAGEKHLLIAKMTDWFEAQHTLQVNRLVMQQRCMMMLKSGFLISIVGLFAAAFVLFLHSMSDLLGK